MSEKPPVLSETPPVAADLLSDLLNSMHLAGTVLFRADFHEPWSVTTPDACQLAQVLPFRTEHIIPFHIIASGGCWLELPGQEPLWLQEGDAVLIPNGDGHRIGGRDAAVSIPLGQLLPRRPGNDMLVVKYGGQGNTTSIVCGFLQCDEMLFHPLLRHLPTVLHVRQDETKTDGWLAATIRHTANEASKLLPGSRNMLPRLTELMFVEILRKHMNDLSEDDVGWFAACSDAVTGAALKLLHASPMHDWRVDTLARRVGVSRTVLAEHFKYFLNQPPIQYLAHWRLQLSAQQLKGSVLPIKAIAAQSGYESEAAFSRAFKRHFGFPPGEWRKRQTQS